MGAFGSIREMLGGAIEHLAILQLQKEYDLSEETAKRINALMRGAHQEGAEIGEQIGRQAGASRALELIRDYLRTDADGAALLISDTPVHIEIEFGRDKDEWTLGVGGLPTDQDYDIKRVPTPTAAPIPPMPPADFEPKNHG